MTKETKKKVIYANLNFVRKYSKFKEKESNSLNKFERGGIMQDRHLGQAIIVIGCLLMLTQLISPVIAVAFILSGLSQL